MKNKILKGREIVLLILDGKAPKKIKLLENNTIWDFDEKTNSFSINLLYRLDDEFEIIEDSKVWKPKEDEEYYYLDLYGATVRGVVENGSKEFVKCLYVSGNIFKTEEEADLKKVKINIYNRLKRYAEEHNTKKTKQWAIYYDMDNNKIRPLCNVCLSTLELGNIYFTSKEVCERAIKEIGEDNIKKLFED